MDVDWTLVATHCGAFLTGGAIGAVGTYIADRATDQRRRQEDDKGIRKIWEKLESEMPALYKEIAEDLSRPENSLMREFILISNSRVVFSGNKPRFIYEIAKHKDLVLQVDRLRQNGFVGDGGGTSASPIYFFTDAFVDLTNEYSAKGWFK